MSMTASAVAVAEGKYGPGASDQEIKVGNFMPYSGPASAYGVIGRAQAAYFAKINAEGGVNGRKINFISYDDGYSAPKALEQTRKLVESDEVLLLFNPLGTASNAAIQRYMNQRKVPQLMVASGATRWGDPASFPWTMGFQPTYQAEGRAYARYILAKHPNSTIAVIWQNDDAGKDMFKGLKDGLGEKTSLIISDAPYEMTEPTIDSQMVRLKNSGAQIFVIWAGPKQAAQAIRKAAELGWKPTTLLGNVSNSVAAVLAPAGLENAKGIISNTYMKDPTDPAWKDDAGVKTWHAFMDQHFPQGDKSNILNVYAYVVAQTLVQVLKQCGDDLTRENVMKQAANLRNVTSEMLIPGISVTTGPTDYFPIEQIQLMQFDGQAWRLLGDVLSGE